MTFLDRFEKVFGRFVIPNFLPLWLLGQITTFLAVKLGSIRLEQLYLNGHRIYDGEAWRVLSFMLAPESYEPLWFLISLAVAWFMGSSLIQRWGEARLALFLGTAWFLTVAGALLLPDLVMDNQYILWLLTLGFAHLFPETEFRLYFFIPVKVKYIGYILWGFYALALFTGSLSEQVAVVASTAAWLLFFGGDLLQTAKHKKRGQAFRRERRHAELVPLHTCSVCGKTNLSHPHLDFRYANGQCTCASYLQKGRCDDETTS